MTTRCLAVTGGVGYWRVQLAFSAYNIVILTCLLSELAELFI